MTNEVTNGLGLSLGGSAKSLKKFGSGTRT